MHNTKKNNDWAHNNFVDARNKENPCPEDLRYKHHLMWLLYPTDACETRMRAGNKYPASTIFGLLGGLLGGMQAIPNDWPNFKILGLKRCILSLMRSGRLADPAVCRS